MDKAHARFSEGAARNVFQGQRTSAATAGEEEGLLDAEAACQLLSVHRNTLYRLIQTDGLPALRLTRGGRWRFQREALLDWLELRSTSRGT